MRILIVNKFWYYRGGDCVVAMETASLLHRMGHDVRIFSMQHPNNVECNDAKDFVTQVHFDSNLSQKIRAMRRSMGDQEVKQVFSSILQQFQPDVVHLHNIHSYLSPIVARLAHEYGARVVWTMHDYKLFCPSYSCLRNGVPCDSCIDHPTDVVTHRCMKQSLIASIAALFESTKWNINKLSQWVDMFICPSQFMASKMLHAGFPSEKLTVLHNFLSDNRHDTSPVMTGRDDYCCFVGRLSPEKGVDALLQAASKLQFAVKIAGDGPLFNKLSREYSNSNNIEFLGSLNHDEVNRLLRLARFSVIPSRWWENNPLSIIESLSAGTPVVGTRMGGIPELIDEHNGILTDAGDVSALSVAMQQAWDAHWDYAAISRKAASLFNPQVYYKELFANYLS